MADNSAPPQTVNPYASALNRILSSLIENAGEGAVEAAIFAAWPAFFATPVIGWIGKKIVDLFVSKFGTFFYQNAAKITTKLITDAQADFENSKLKTGGGKLQDAIASGDKDAIKKAEQEVEDDWGNIIHMDGAAVP